MAAEVASSSLPLSISIESSSTNITERSLNCDADDNDSHHENCSLRSSGDDCSSLSSSDVDDDDKEKKRCVDESFVAINDDNVINDDAMTKDDNYFSSIDADNKSANKSIDPKSVVKDLQRQLAEALSNVEKYKKQVGQSHEQSLLLVKKCSLLEAKLSSSSSTNMTHRSPSPSDSLNSSNATPGINTILDSSALATTSTRNSAPLPVETDLNRHQSSSSEDVMELVKLVHHYQTELKHLMDENNTLQRKIDNDGLIITKLKASQTTLEENKSQLEMELLNQISSLAQSNRRMEEDHAAQLKEKCDLIEKLQMHIRENLNNTVGGAESSISGVQQQEELQSLVKLVEQENEELRCDVHTLSSRNAVLNAELLNLTDQMEAYRQLETIIVPELKSQLESARSSLSCVERDMALINQEKQWMRQKLRKSTTVAKSNKCEMETSFLQQLQGMEEAHRIVVTEMESSLREKTNIIQSLEKTVRDLNDKLLRYEANSELDSISASQDVEYLRQQYLDSQEEVKRLQESITLVRKSHKECKDSNAKLLKDLDNLQRQIKAADERAATSSTQGSEMLPSFSSVQDTTNKDNMPVIAEEEDESNIPTATSSASSEDEMWC